MTPTIIIDFIISLFEIYLDLMMIIFNFVYYTTNSIEFVDHVIFIFPLFQSDQYLKLIYTGFIIAIYFMLTVHIVYFIVSLIKFIMLMIIYSIVIAIYNIRNIFVYDKCNSEILYDNKYREWRLLIRRQNFYPN